MILDPNTNHYIHFGDARYEDFTKTKDEHKREEFRRRNYRWKYAEPYTASYLSYYLLW